MIEFIYDPNYLEFVCQRWRHTAYTRLYVDLEGRRLCRHGTIDVAQIHDDAAGISYIVDVTTLGNWAFCDSTLKGVFENPNITKVFFDVRNDSDALWGIFGVYLVNVEDLQLYELATRTHSRRYLSGLGKAIERHAGLTWEQRQEWMAVKDAGRRLFAPELGGNYDVFAQRPMSRALMDYCVQDVALLPRLEAVYSQNLDPRWRQLCEQEAKARVDMCFSPVWRGEGRDCAQAPAGWA